MSRYFLACSVHLTRDMCGVIYSTLGIEPQPARRAPRRKLKQIERHADGSFSLAAHFVFRALGCKVPCGISTKQLVRVVHQGCDSLIAGLLVPRQANDLDVANV